MQEKKPIIEVGKIINTHGVRGEVKIEPWCDSPYVFKGIRTLFLEDGRSFAVLSRRVASERFVLAALEGVDNVDKAALLKGKVILAKREEIVKKPNSYFICDLIGLPVIDADSGRVYGTLTSIDDGVAQELYTVETENGDVLIPNVPAFVRRLDLDEGVFITPIPGFFD